MTSIPAAHPFEDFSFFPHNMSIEDHLHRLHDSLQLLGVPEDRIALALRGDRSLFEEFYQQEVHGILRRFNGATGCNVRAVPNVSDLSGMRLQYEEEHGQREEAMEYLSCRSDGGTTSIAQQPFSQQQQHQAENEIVFVTPEQSQLISQFGDTRQFLSPLPVYQSSHNANKKHHDDICYGDESGVGATEERPFTAEELLLRSDPQQQRLNPQQPHSDPSTVRSTIVHDTEGKFFASPPEFPGFHSLVGDSASPL